MASRVAVDVVAVAAVAGVEAGPRRASRAKRRRCVPRSVSDTAPSPAPARRPAAASRPVRDEDEIAPAPRAPRSTPFGSVWDSQLGTPVAPAAASLAPLSDDEDFDEPEIPEYLIAEQRRGANRGGRAWRSAGGRSAYQSAMERERYGRGGGGGGINRYPDVSARTRPEPQRDDRGFGRGDRTPAPPARSSNEPWSDVPPELEAMLRAQVAQKPVSRPAPSPLTPPTAAPELAEMQAPPKARATRSPSARAPRTTARARSAGTPEPRQSRPTRQRKPERSELRKSRRSLGPRALRSRRSLPPTQQLSCRRRPPPSHEPPASPRQPASRRSPTPPRPAPRRLPSAGATRKAASTEPS